MTSQQERRRRLASARADPLLAVLHGFHPLKHALRFGGEVIEAWAAEDADIPGLAARLAPDVADRIDSLCQRVPRAELDAMGAPGRVNILAVARRPEDSVERALNALDRPVVFLDHPTHHGNIGAVVRVAAAAGAAGVLTTGPHDPWHPNAIRGGAGLQFAVPVARVAALPPTDRPLVAFDPAGDLLLPDALQAPREDAPSPVLVFGSERRGVRPELLERADRRVRIPMQEGVSSLNLATSVAVALYCGGSLARSSA